jgi:hypothetical protein
VALFERRRLIYNRVRELMKQFNIDKDVAIAKLENQKIANGWDINELMQQLGAGEPKTNSSIYLMQMPTTTDALIGEWKVIQKLDEEHGSGWRRHQVYQYDLREKIIAELRKKSKLVGSHSWVDEFLSHNGLTFSGYFVNICKREFKNNELPVVKYDLKSVPVDSINQVKTEWFEGLKGGYPIEILNSIFGQKWRSSQSPQYRWRRSIVMHLKEVAKGIREEQPGISDEISLDEAVRLVDDDFKQQDEGTTLECYARSLELHKQAPKA